MACSMAAAAISVSSLSGGRPAQDDRAAAIPSFVRSPIRRRSKCAIAPKTWNTSSPAADEVSRRSSSERNSRPLCLKPSTVLNSPSAISRAGRDEPHTRCRPAGQNRQVLPDRAVRRSSRRRRPQRCGSLSPLREAVGAAPRGLGRRSRRGHNRGRLAFGPSPNRAVSG